MGVWKITPNFSYQNQKGGYPETEVPERSDVPYSLVFEGKIYPSK